MDDLGSSFRLRQFRDVGRLPIILTALAIVASSGMLKLGVVLVLELPVDGSSTSARAAPSSAAAAVSSMSMSLVVFAHVVLVRSISSSDGGR